MKRRGVADDEVIGGLVVLVIAVGLVGLLIVLGFGSCDKKSKPATGDSDAVFAKQKVLGKWQSEDNKHTLEFTTGSHAIVDGKFTYYDFYAHGLSSKPIYLHLGRKKTNEFTFEATDNELILVYSKRCGWQSDQDNDDDFSQVVGGKYSRIGAKPTTATPEEKPDDKLAKLKTRLTDCEAQVNKLDTMLKRMDADKATLVKRLGDMGIKSKDDLKGNRPAQVLAKELADMAREREQVRKAHDDLTYKVEQINSTLRRLDRLHSVEGSAVSEKELDELLADVGDKLENKPKVAEAVEVEEILAKELPKKTEAPKPEPKPEAKK